MKTKRYLARLCSLCLMVFLFGGMHGTANAASAIALSSDEQWIVGLTSDMEYITESAYQAYGGASANNAYWTKLDGGVRADGTGYTAFKLLDGKLQVASAWYGETIYIRTQGNAGMGVAVEIPEYAQLKEQYKKAIRVLSVYDPGDDGTWANFYWNYISAVSDDMGYLIDADDSINIQIASVSVQAFNTVPLLYLTDAEGNYVYDMVTYGPNAGRELDISGKAAWVLSDYIKEGYGYLIGHDTLYSYGGVTDVDYVPDSNDTQTREYVADSKINGHWNMNWLMGTNQVYSQASPYDANSMILNISDYTDKTYLYGDNYGVGANADGSGGASHLRVTALTQGDPLTELDARTPTNYPYSAQSSGADFSVGSVISAGVTHTNQQVAYGKIWLEFASNTMAESNGGKFGALFTDRNAGLTGTNNFYLTTNGNFGMIQIGHFLSEAQQTEENECRILANTMLYLSQRCPCEVCASLQNGNEEIHAVTRISSAEELAMIGDTRYGFTYPLDGCYMLMNDITLPDDWVAIADFSGHFNANSHHISAPDGVSVFAQEGEIGENTSAWNLGEDYTEGYPFISEDDGKTTGIARVEGYLNQLFGTDSSEDYNEYTVTVTGSDGKSYTVQTTREGKYVISNLPTTNEKMTATITDANGVAVTQYGAIYAQIEESAWENNETVPLRLESDKARPIPDETVYEDTDAVFVGGVNVDVPLSEVSSVKWYYRTGPLEDWTPVQESTWFLSEQGQTMRVEVSQEQGAYIETSLTVKNVQQTMEHIQFKAVLVIDGESYDTYEAREDSATGTLYVQERPYTVTPTENASAWQGDTLMLTSTLTYYKAVGDGVSVRWQYRANADCAWENVTGSSIVTNASVSTWIQENENWDETEEDIISTSNLVLQNASMDYSGYQFRAVWEDTVKNRVFVLEDYAREDGKNGIVSVQLKKILCVTNPSNIKAELDLGGSQIAGAYSYEATFEYVSDSDAIDITWQYKTSATGEYKNVSSLSLGSPNVSILSQSALGDNTYLITTRLTFTNPPASFDFEPYHYYFRAVASMGEVVSYSGSGDFSVNYSIDIDPGTPVIQTDGTKYIYTYPNLTIYAPEDLRSFSVTVDSGTVSITSPGALPSGVSSVSGSQGYSYNSDTKQAWETVQAFFRQLEFTVQQNKEADIDWFISYERMPDYDALTGKYYEYVADDGVLWTQAYDLARTRYNAVLQTTGSLATIHTASQQTLVDSLVGNNYAWIGLTNDVAYQKSTTTSTNIYDWVTGLYTQMLGRDPDSGGLDYYVNAILNGTKSMSDVAVGICTSAECVAKNYSNTEFVNRVYLSVLMRSSDSSGLSAWVGQLNGGMARGTLVSYFTDSSEFTTLSAKLWSNQGTYAWVDGTALSYSKLISSISINGYGRMKPDGNWEAVANVSSYSVTVEDMIEYSSGSLGGWTMQTGSSFWKTAEGVDNRSGYTGIALLAPGSTSTGVNSAMVHNVYLEKGHTYWFYTMIGEYGDSNGNMVVQTPFFDELFSYWSTGSSQISQNFTWGGATGTYQIRVATNGNGPNYTGVSGQLYHMELVDLNAFTSKGLAAPTAQWMEDNIGVFNGTKSIQHSASVSTSDGYVVEYSNNDNIADHTDKMAKTQTTVKGQSSIPTGSVVAMDYRPDTDVLLSCGVSALENISAENPASVTFTITAQNGTVTSHTFTDLTMPAAGTVRAYIPYHVMDQDGALTVQITSSDNVVVDTSKIEGTVMAITENTPPDPQAMEENEGFVLAAVPDAESEAHTWYTYACQSVDGTLQYTQYTHTATLNAVLAVQPAEQVPTAYDDTMKSGYGMYASVTGRVQSDDEDVIAPQTAVMFFPEFAYQGYWRVMEITAQTTTQTVLSFKQNPYSFFDARVHFLPLWFPDTTYTTFATVRDAWTPCGELTQGVTDSLNIQGSVYDDWYIANQ